MNRLTGKERDPITVTNRSWPMDALSSLPQMKNNLDCWFNEDSALTFAEPYQPVSENSAARHPYDQICYVMRMFELNGLFPKVNAL